MAQMQGKMPPCPSECHWIARIRTAEVCSYTERFEHEKMPWTTSRNLLFWPGCLRLEHMSSLCRSAQCRQNCDPPQRRIISLFMYCSCVITCKYNLCGFILFLQLPVLWLDAMILHSGEMGYGCVWGDGWMGGRMDRWLDRGLFGWVVDEWNGGWMNGWANGWMG